MQSLQQLFQSTVTTPGNNSVRALADMAIPGEPISLHAIVDLVSAMAESYLITYKDDTWHNELGRYFFGIVPEYISWPDSQNDRLSSFKFKLPVGWEVRIHEHRSTTSRFKAWRGTGREVCVNKNELPSYLHDDASGHSWTRPNYLSIKKAFDAICPDYPAELLITKPGTINMPSGYKGNMTWHQQGLQKTKRGEFAVSGSAPDVGYVYFTNSKYGIVNVLTPRHESYNHLGGCQVAEDYLAVGYERLEDKENGASKILFYNITDITAPVPLEHLTITRSRASDTAGAVGLISLVDCWLVLVANWGAERLDFYTSNTPDLMNSATHFATQPRWSWSNAQDHLANGSIDNNWGGYQNINLFSQIAITPRLDDLWFIGTHTSLDIYDAMPDWADLYHLNLSSDKPSITKVSKKHFFNSGDGQRFLYASGFFYHAKTRAFEVYASEAHISDGKCSRINRWI